MYKCIFFLSSYSSNICQLEVKFFWRCSSNISYLAGCGCNVRTFSVYFCIAGVFVVVIGLMTCDVFAVVRLNEMLSIEDKIWRRYVPCP